MTHPDVFWRKLFGSKYPRARKRFWRAPATEPWVGKYTAKLATTPGRTTQAAWTRPRDQPQARTGRGGGPERIQTTTRDDPIPGPGPTRRQAPADPGPPSDDAFRGPAPLMVTAVHGLTPAQSVPTSSQTGVG